MALFAVIAAALAVPKILRVTSSWLEDYNQKCRRLEIEASHSGPTIMWAENGLLFEKLELEAVRKCDCIHHVNNARCRANQLKE